MIPEPYNRKVLELTNILGSLGLSLADAATGAKGEGVSVTGLLKEAVRELLGIHSTREPHS